ncbi:hypothetical protein AB0N14_38110 [Streptomyces sp. NPDC051104]|uniref:hypothetical protein n=1 Tax=Streptomyces sp. NPDC051104 TaxID=3155044 RepID=UPI00341D646C
MRIEGLAHADGCQLPECVGDVLGEELRDEGDNCAGEALCCVRPVLRPGAQGGDEDAPERLQGEGVLARLARAGVGQRGDGDDDSFGDVDEQRGYLRLGAGELCGSAPANSAAASASLASTARR